MSRQAAVKLCLLAAILGWLLAAASCVSVAPDVLATDGPLGRQVQRLVDRHDSYVLEDEALPQAALDAALAQSAALESLSGLPTVGRGSLRLALVPVAQRHDEYVLADSALDDLERETYLASTDGLRRLVGHE